MRPPRARNAPVNRVRKNRWLADFRSYRSDVSEARIEEWLQQFRAADRDIAARVLDVVDFYGPQRIAQAYRTLLATLPGWHERAADRQGRWKFVAMSSSEGDSGGSMLHHFRLATRLDRRIYDGLFAHRSELLQLGLGADDTVVLLDDFIGTGNQVSTAWDEAFSELVAGVGNVYLMVVAARRRGVDLVRERTGLSVLSGVELHDSDDIFSEDCPHFTSDEKATFLRYCRRANKQFPAGYGKCGLVVVFSHRCPNDSVPALHAWHERWQGLFPRNDVLAVPA